MRAGAKGKYNPEMKQAIFECLKEGLNDKQTCEKVGINQDTFYRWKNEKAEFCELIKTAKAEYNSTLVSKLEDSLYRRATGFEYEETETEYISDKEGNPRIKKQTKKKKRTVPDTPALIFALCNLMPDKWKNRLNTQLDGKVKTESDTQVSLANVPDDLLAQVIDKINGK